MNILFLTTHFNEGGISRYCLALSTQLNKMGHRVFVASDRGGLVEELEKNGIIHFSLNLRTKSELSLKVWLSLFALKKILKDNDIQIIHAQTRVTQVLACLTQSFYKVPYISTCHGFFKPRFFRRKFPCWGQRAIAISRPVKEHLIKDLQVPAAKVVYIRHGLDFSRFKRFSPEIINECRKGLGLAEGPVAGIIARLSSIKGHEFLLQAMPQVLQEFPLAQLLIIGEGGLKNKLSRLAKALGLSKNIIFVPAVKDTAVALDLMDVFVMPSLQEGLGLSVMEAMAAEKPIVASRVGGIPDLIKDGQTGILVSAGDPSSLGSAIISLLKDKELRTRLGESAGEFIRKEYPLEQMVVETEKVYAEVLRERQ
ncbi:MAG: glycosyltransferase family 4 protein [Candidatus Omnitrophota bacterium]